LEMLSTDLYSKFEIIVGHYDPGVIRLVSFR